MKSKKQMRCDDVLSLLTEGGNAVFFTLTTKDEVDFAEIRCRWRLLRHDFTQYLRRNGVRPLFVMNYERHPGYLQKVVADSRTTEKVIRSDGRPHGWHIHGVINCRLPAYTFLEMTRRAGFGRVDFRRVRSKGVADYLTKHALKAYRGISKACRARMECQRMRLVNVSRGLPPLSCYVWHSPDLDRSREIFRDLVRHHRDDYGKIVNPLRNWKLAQCIVLLRLSSLGDFQRLLDRLEREAQRMQRECGNFSPGVRNTEGKAFPDGCVSSSSRNEDEKAAISSPDVGQLPRPFAQAQFLFPAAKPEAPKRGSFFSLNCEQLEEKSRAKARGPRGWHYKKRKISVDNC